MLTQFDPFAEIERMQDELFGRRKNGQGRTLQPAVDVYDAEDAVRLEVELPGVQSEDVEVDFDDGILTISGERRRGDTQEQQKPTLTERAFGRFERRFQIPETVDPSGIDATLKSGVLHVHLPKRESAKPRRIEVKA